MYFTEEPNHIRLLRASMQRFVEMELPREKIRAWDKAGEAPLSVFKSLAETGVCGLTIDEAHGGAGVDLVAAVAVIEELSTRGGAASGPFIHAAFYGGLNISANGSEEQKQALLPRIARGELLFAYGLSEPDVGGDLASVKTTARLSADDSEVILSGTKRWCTAAHVADYLICLVRSGPADERYRNLSLVLVPREARGLTRVPLDHVGLRYTHTFDVHFDDVRIPKENILGGPDGWNRGWSMLANEALDVEKLEITAVALGNMRAAVEDAWAYAEERQQFGRKIGAHQAVAHDLAEVKTLYQAARHMLYHAAWLAQTGQPCSVEASMAKLFVADTGLQVALKCQQVLGAYGASGDFDMERYVREAQLMPMVGGSSKMQKNNIVARLGLGRD